MALTSVIKDSVLRTVNPGYRVIEVIATETAPGTTKATSVEISLGKPFKSVVPMGAPAVIPTTDTNFVSAQTTKVALLGATDTKNSAIKFTYTSGVNESIVIRQLLMVQE